MIRTVNLEASTPGEVVFERTTPKRKAQEILLGAIQAQMECWEGDEAMTGREKRLVYEQMIKLEKRLAPILGVRP